MRTQIVCGGRKGNQEEAFALPVAVLDQDAAVRCGRRVAFLASDDTAADIGALAENLGFSPIQLYGLSEG
jgi:predicted dinucleotide-binding enzyme